MIPESPTDDAFTFVPNLSWRLKQAAHISMVSADNANYACAPDITIAEALALAAMLDGKSPDPAVSKPAAPTDTEMRR